MSEANPGKPAGPLTFEGGLAQLKAKMAASQTTSDAAVRPLEGETAEETPGEEIAGEEAAQEENAEAVSTDESETVKEPEADNRPVLLPDGSEITVEEARKGYLRQADWTRKSQDLARARETASAEHQNAMKEVATLVQSLSQLQEPEPNWLALAQDPNTDPKQLQAAQLYWQHKKSTEAKAREVLQRTEAQKVQAQKAAAFQALTESKLEPSWKDPKVLKGALDQLSDYWVERGLPADMLEGVSNPTIIEILEESRRYRALSANKPKATLAVKGKPAPVKPGAKSASSPQAEFVRSVEERFNKNPTIANAAALTKARAGLR